MGPLSCRQPATVLGYAWLLLAVCCAVCRGFEPGQKLPPAGLSYVCRAEFTFEPLGVDLISGIHTFIGHGTPCILPGCAYTGPAAWSTVGFDTGSTVQLWGPGRLIEETYDCIDVQPDSVMNTDCARDAVQLMTQRGWPDDAYYKVWRIAYFCNQNITQEDCSPSPEGNVCWQFTCGVLECAYPKIVAGRSPGQCALPTAALIVDQVRSGLRQLPANWTCPLEDYGDGKLCHCHCGSLDPDCLDQTLESANCEPGTVCLPPGDRCMDSLRVRRARAMWSVVDRLTALDANTYDIEQALRRVV